MQDFKLQEFFCSTVTLFKVLTVGSLGQSTKRPDWNENRCIQTNDQQVDLSLEAPPMMLSEDALSEIRGWDSLLLSFLQWHLPLEQAETIESTWSSFFRCRDG